MDTVYDWGVSVIAWLQRASPELDGFFAFVTLFGDELFLVVVIPLIYWSVDRDSGVQLVLIVLASVVVNSLAKSLLGQPRPADYSVSVVWLADATGYGLPSGHAQMAVILAGYGWWRWPNWPVRMLAAAMVVGVPLSRVYLGVHFPTDVAGGAVLALLMLWAAHSFGPGAAARFTRLGFRWQLALALMPGVVTMIVRPDEDGFAVGGAMIGLLGGMVLERRWVGFEAGGPLARRVARYAIGMAILAILFWGLGSLSGPDGFDDWREAVRYGLAASWVSLGAPWVFTMSRRGTLAAA